MIDLSGKLGRHRDFRYEVATIGTEQAPVLIIDNFLSDPDILVHYAASVSVFQPSRASYPGLRAEMPEIYPVALQAFLNRLIGDVFGIADPLVVGGTCGFALVTTPPSQLDIVQRLPHFDATNRKQIALLHYLSPAPKGGTAFYRHRRTGYETIDEARVAHYTDAVRQELSMTGPPPRRYIVEDSPMFERIAAFESVYNRVLVYRSINLHSASIVSDFAFDPDPRNGRLTANAIFVYR